ncbi:Splicing factor, arginine/serine-rich 7 [Zea mays]|uniref:Splicing factor, arginine/serine-rich 7 n=1 Tax=Zea mays TaxID=4577 RepID=A0A1D6Q4M8_MAIZE|nr:Splicing factor, arginine/serine-rich 7 [Zea mays]
MARVFVGNLDPRVTAREIEDEFRTFGVLKSVWVARKPPPDARRSYSRSPEQQPQHESPYANDA